MLASLISSLYAADSRVGITHLITVYSRKPIAQSVSVSDDVHVSYDMLTHTGHNFDCCNHFNCYNQAKGLFSCLLPAALRAAQTCRYLVYSEADYEVFRPQGRHVAPIGVKFGMEDGPLLPAKFHPHRCNDKGVGPPKLKFLLRFDRNGEYKRPTGAYPLRDFHKICRICTSFQDALGVKIWLDLLKGLWSYGGFKLRGSGFPQIFSAP